jgi:McrBC 5-methylcytosine restriction system component
MGSRAVAQSCLENMSPQLIQVSPQGRHSGLMFASSEAGTVLIQVFPKVWREGPPVVRSVVATNASRLVTIAAFEGDVVQLDAPAWVDPLVTRLLTVAADAGHGPTIDGTEVANPFLVAVAAPPRGYSPSDAAVTTSLVALLALGARNGVRLRPVTGEVGPSGNDTAAIVIGRHALVAAVEAAIRFARPGYVEVEDEPPAVRGRIVMESAVLAHLGLSTRLRCRYEEHVVATPVLRVINTALRVVSRPEDELYDLLLAALGDTVERAVRLGHLLHEAPVYAAREALTVAKSIRLSRLDSRWIAPLRLAREVLERHGRTPQPGEEHARIGLVTIHTEAIWERLLVRALREVLPLEWVWSKSDLTGLPGLTVPPPWSRANQPPSSRESYPDVIVVPDRQGLWCLDAKYKIKRDGPERGDAYQIFAYSHLAQQHDGSRVRIVEKCGLLYPINGDSLIVSSMMRQRPAEGTPELMLLGLPFPNPAIALNGRSWHNYVRRLGADMVAALGLPTRPNPSLANMVRSSSEVSRGMSSATPASATPSTP